MVSSGPTASTAGRNRIARCRIALFEILVEPRALCASTRTIGDDVAVRPVVKTIVIRCARAIRFLELHNWLAELVHKERRGAPKILPGVRKNRSVSVVNLPRRPGFVRRCRRA